MPTNEWEPTRYTAPLSPSFTSAWDRWEPVIQAIWRGAFGYELAAYQCWLLRHILETYPPGHPRAGELRYRQAVVSMGRQNGKSEIVAALGIWGLLRASHSLVIGIASRAEQARIIYDRAQAAINGNPTLKAQFSKLTDTRGIRAKNGSKWEIKPANSAALQGLPIALGIVDELHVIKDAALWTDLVNGTGARPNALIVGVTTAGSDDSDLLLGLYENGEKALSGELERFGFFLWEAEEPRVPESDEDLLRLLKQANPLLASGITDAETFLSDVRSMPDPQEVVRYRLNRFTESVSAFIPLETWAKCTRPPGEEFPASKHVVIGVDRTGDWAYASLAAAVKTEDGMLHTELVHWENKPTLGRLTDLCVKAVAANPGIQITFAVDNARDANLIFELKRRGLIVYPIGYRDMLTGASTFYAKTVGQGLQHAGDPLLSKQLSTSRRKDKEGGFRIIGKESTNDIDGLMATVSALYVAETVEPAGLQLFV